MAGNFFKHRTEGDAVGFFSPRTPEPGPDGSWTSPWRCCKLGITNNMRLEFLMTTGELPGKKKTAGLRRGANAGSGRAGRLLPARRSPPGRLPRRRSGPLGRRAALGRKPAALEKETLTGCLAGLMAPTRETQLLALRFARRSWQDFARESRQAVEKRKTGRPPGLPDGGTIRRCACAGKEKSRCSRAVPCRTRTPPCFSR